MRADQCGQRADHSLAPRRDEHVLDCPGSLRMLRAETKSGVLRAEIRLVLCLVAKTLLEGRSVSSR